MFLEDVKEFLNDNDVKYLTIIHSPAYSAQETAASARIPGREVAKTVMVKVDGKMTMCVLPAPFKVDFDLLKRSLGANIVELAGEDDFGDKFPGCEVGAMPPFGNLVGMDVIVDYQLTEDEDIVFNAGSFSELMRISFEDFQRIVDPQVFTFSVMLGHKRCIA